MHYKYITLIGDHYTAAGNTGGGDYSGTNEEGKSGHRTAIVVWGHIVNKLKNAIVARAALQVAPPAAVAAGGPPIINMQSLKAKFEKFQTLDTKGERSRQISIQTTIIQNCRQWLAAEGAQATVDGDIIMGPMDDLTVYYDHTAAAQNMTRVHFQGGKLFSDAACTKPISTNSMVTHFSGPGHAIYVMSAQGNLHLASHVIGNYHHSSLLAGQPVAAAGEIKVTQGNITWLSNKSGHYAPNPDHLCQILHQLQKSGCSMDFHLVYCTRTLRKRFASPAIFDNWLGANHFSNYELGKLLRYSRYLTKPAILRCNGWRWHLPHEPEGVYTIANNTIVASKTVRKWFKSNGYQVDAERQLGAGR